MKKGVAPIIAVAILIVLVVSLGLIVYSFSEEIIPQQVLLSGSPVELRCPEVTIEAGLVGNTVEVINRGNIAVYGVRINVVSPGEVVPHDVLLPILQGKSVVIDLQDEGIQLPATVELSLQPILLGQTQNGRSVEYVCDETIKLHEV